MSDKCPGQGLTWGQVSVQMPHTVSGGGGGVVAAGID